MSDVSLSAPSTVHVNGVPASVSAGTFLATAVPVQEGATTLTATATDAMGHVGVASVQVILEPTLVTLPLVHTPSRPVTGTVAATPVPVAVHGVAAPGPPGTSAQVPATEAIQEGASQPPAPITDVVDDGGPPQDPVVRQPLPVVIITAPATVSYVNISPTTVNGTVDDPTATVTVNAVAAAVVHGRFSVAVPLAEGPNILTASARTPSGSVGVSSIQVTLDTTPPRVTITSPPAQFVTTDSTIAVAGIVNDLVVGTVNDQQAQVTVNGAAAQVANRTFLAPAVPLVLGANVIQAVGRDRVGNAATTQITVLRQALRQEPQLRLHAGNSQTAPIGAQLPAPLVVAVTDATGSPMAHTPVIFKVTQNDGMVTAGGPPAPAVIATTNAQGQAQVQWTLGARAGAGANAVEAYAIGFAGTALFAAAGTPGPAGTIVVDTGNAQIGVIQQPLPRPLLAVVVDSGHNRLAGVPVTFTVTQGGGSVAGQSSVTVTTDTDGRAAATLTLGPQEGHANHLVEATFPSYQGFPAAFTASGRVSGDPALTTIAGVVLDNSNVPIPGVTIRAVLTTVLQANLRAVQTAAAVQTDAQAQFVIPQAPVGFVKLMVDGATAQRPGHYPALEYDLVTIAGQTNTVGMPIYLLPLRTENQLCVTATTGGGTLTLPEAPGFSLTFGPGQVTFPGGAQTGCVSVTMVHGDKIPMVPGFGQQPRFIVTIQPAGAVFNPPAPITLPNVDGLRPRSVTEMYSFDHDIGAFVAIGTGVVSDDGQVIRSSPGVGVVKAGWHCGGNPAKIGTVADCPECQICQGSGCMEDPAQQDRPCNNNQGCCNHGVCEPLSVEILHADITQDQIEVQLGPQCATGSLALELIGPHTHTIRTVNRNAGTFIETFDIANIPNRREFTSIRATWTVNTVAVSGDFPYHIKIHGTTGGGNVRHSVYNTPHEAQCPGTATSDVYITTVVGNACQYRASTLNSTFQRQLDINGSGVSINNGTLQIERLRLCLNNAPVGSRGRLYRAVNAIRPACGTSVSEGTVASDEASLSGDPLHCGSQLFIYGLGNGLGTTKTVTDNCPACGPSPRYARQLDNYTTRQACEPGAFVDHGTFKTIEIFGR